MPQAGPSLSRRHSTNPTAELRSLSIVYHPANASSHSVVVCWGALDAVPPARSPSRVAMSHAKRIRDATSSVRHTLHNSSLQTSQHANAFSRFFSGRCKIIVPVRLQYLNMNGLSDCSVPTSLTSGKLNARPGRALLSCYNTPYVCTNG